MTFTIYKENNVSLTGKIVDDCLSLDSLVYGDEYDSEKHYEFSKEETEKLFNLVSMNNFIELCQKKHLNGMEEFLNKNNIKYKTFTY